VAFALIIKAAVDTSEPNAVLGQPRVAVIPSAVAADSVKPNENGQLLNETVAFKTPNAAQEDLTKAELVKTKPAVKVANRKAKQKENNEMPAEYVQTQAVTQPAVVNKSRATAKPASNSVKMTELIADKSDAKPKSRWSIFKDNVKNGEKSQCTQAEISMNQCSN
jgi:hypothetical protein